MTNILFVDDEASVLSTLRRTFRKFDEWKCFFANSPREALEVLAKEDIAVLVSDHRMPQMTGAEFLTRVREKRPKTIRIMLTGQAGLEDVKKAINDGAIFRFLLKPWDDGELRQVVSQAVDLWKVSIENERLKVLTEKQNAQLKGLNSELEEMVDKRSSQLRDALHTAQALNKSLQESLLTSAKSFFSLIELARPEIGSHSRRVADHSTEIGKRLKLTESDIAQLEIAALLHDIGKLGMPPFLLEKAVADLSGQEFEMYRMHPVVGSESLREIPSYDEIRSIIQKHHEQYDGRGIPAGLNDSDISMPSYIIGLADQYDYLINNLRRDREYTYQYAYQKISDMADRAYPASLIRHFLEYIEKINQHQADQVESKVSPINLIPGMILARDLYTMTGTLLVTRGAILSAQNVKRIRSIAKVDPIAGFIFIRKTSNAPSVTGDEIYV